MLTETLPSTISPRLAAALVMAARAVQPEARSFGEDPNEGYLLLHAALTQALHERAEADPATLVQALRSRACALAETKSASKPDELEGD